MYYYIFEPPQGPKEFERTAQIKELLNQLGIAGEMAAPQPGKSVEDLVKTALTKRYSTIVTVGGMELINKVARALVNHDAVLGIIPIHDDPDITELIGTGDWKVAAEQLKRRRWQHIQLGRMNGSICFLVPATVTVPAGKKFQIEADSFSIKSEGPVVVRITPQKHETGDTALFLDILTEQKPRKGFLKMFGTKDEAPSESHFLVKKLTLSTADTYPVVVAGESLTSTPIECTTEPKGLRLIVGKGFAS